MSQPISATRPRPSRPVGGVTRWKLCRHKFSSFSLLGNDEMAAFGPGPQGEESLPVFRRPLSRPQTPRRWKPVSASPRHPGRG